MVFWYGDGMGGWGYLLMTATMMLFWGAVIFGLVMLTRYLTRSSQRQATAPHGTAEQLLAERFARGEIDEDEYNSRLAILRGR